MSCFCLHFVFVCLLVSFQSKGSICSFKFSTPSLEYRSDYVFSLYSVNNNRTKKEKETIRASEIFLQLLKVLPFQFSRRFRIAN